MKNFPIKSIVCTCNFYMSYGINSAQICASNSYFHHTFDAPISFTEPTDYIVPDNGVDIQLRSRRKCSK